MFLAACLFDSSEPEKSCLVCLLSPRRDLMSRAFEFRICYCLRTRWLLFVMLMYGMFAPSSSTLGNSMKLREEAETEERRDRLLE